MNGSAWKNASFDLPYKWGKGGAFTLSESQTCLAPHHSTSAPLASPTLSELPAPAIESTHGATRAGGDAHRNVQNPIKHAEEWNAHPSAPLSNVAAAVSKVEQHKSTSYSKGSRDDRHEGGLLEKIHECVALASEQRVRDETP